MLLFLVEWVEVPLKYLMKKNIQVITGAKGSARDIVETYLKGDLESTGSICNEHAHHDECGN